MHQVLYKDTYDASTIQALKVIRQEQQQLEQELSSTIEQVCTVQTMHACMMPKQCTKCLIMDNANS
jgi:hypothetical protein